MSPGVIFFVAGVVIGLAGSIMNTIVNHLLELGGKKIKRWREQEMLDIASARSAPTENTRAFEVAERITMWWQRDLVDDHLFYSRSVSVLVLVAGLIGVALIVRGFVRAYPKSMVFLGFAVGWLITALCRLVFRWIRGWN